jgi:hypothetical protein
VAHIEDLETGRKLRLETSGTHAASAFKVLVLPERVTCDADNLKLRETRVVEEMIFRSAQPLASTHPEPGRPGNHGPPYPGPESNQTRILLCENLDWGLRFCEFLVINNEPRASVWLVGRISATLVRVRHVKSGKD